MSVYIQQTTGSYDLIRDALVRGVVDGVIYGAKGATPPTLRQSMKDMEHLRADVLFDPQFYLSTVSKASDRLLKRSYEQWYEGGRGIESFDDEERVRKDAKETLMTQETLRLSRTISPTVPFTSFDDDWSVVARRLAEASLNAHLNCSAAMPPKPLLLSFVFSEKALASRRLMDEFIDLLTRSEASGVYLIVVRDDTAYNQGFAPELLENYLRMVHSLGKNNDMEVVIGYTDFVGILLRAAGASAIGVGWTQTARKFLLDNFREKPESIRSNPNPRYASTSLMTSLRFTDVVSIYEADRSLFTKILTGGPLDSNLTGAEGPRLHTWTVRLSEIQHWEALSILDRSLTGKPSEDFDAIEARIFSAIDLYSIIRREKIINDLDDSHLLQWKNAIAAFRTRNDI